MFRVKSKKNSPYCRQQALRIWIVLWWKHFRFCRKYLMIIPDDSLILAYKQGFVAAYFLVPRPQIRLGNPCGGGQHTSVCSVMTQPLPASTSATSKQQRGWNKGVLRAGQFASKADQWPTSSSSGARLYFCKAGRPQRSGTLKVSEDFIFFHSFECRIICWLLWFPQIKHSHIWGTSVNLHIC